MLMSFVFPLFHQISVPFRQQTKPIRHVLFRLYRKCFERFAEHFRVRCKISITPGHNSHQHYFILSLVMIVKWYMKHFPGGKKKKNHFPICSQSKYLKQNSLKRFKLIDIQKGTSTIIRIWFPFSVKCQWSNLWSPFVRLCPSPHPRAAFISLCESNKRNFMVQ